MKSLKGSQTLVNLMRAFAGESQARNRYYFSAGVAEKEGFRQIKDIFIETAENERAHAKVFYNLILEGMAEEPKPVNIEITGNYPVDLRTTFDNLAFGVHGETEEYQEVYPSFARKAEEEGYPEVANAFKLIASVEKHHAQRFQKLYDNLKNDQVFKKDQPVKWICLNCGYIHEGNEAAKVCPACKHPQSYFQLEAENY